MLNQMRVIGAAAIIFALCFSSPVAYADDPIETAGVGIGLTLGNIIFLPVKAIEVTIGAVGGAMSFVVTGNADLTKQIWRDTSEGPYLITPDVARAAIGQRPLLEQK